MNRRQRRDLKFHQRRISVENREERIQRLLEKIDPTIRKNKLEEQKKQLEDRLMDAQSNFESQTRLTERHKQALKTAKNDDGKIRKEIDLERAEAALGQTEDFLELVVEQLEETDEKLEELKKAGTTKKGKS